MPLTLTYSNTQPVKIAIGASFRIDVNVSSSASLVGKILYFNIGAFLPNPSPFLFSTGFPSSGWFYENYAIGAAFINVPLISSPNSHLWNNVRLLISRTSATAFVLRLEGYWTVDLNSTNDDSIVNSKDRFRKYIRDTPDDFNNSFTSVYNSTKALRFFAQVFNDYDSPAIDQNKIDILCKGKPFCSGQLIETWECVLRRSGKIVTGFSEYEDTDVEVTIKVVPGKTLATTSYLVELIDLTIPTNDQEYFDDLNMRHGNKVTGGFNGFVINSITEVPSTNLTIPSNWTLITGTTYFCTFRVTKGGSNPIIIDGNKYQLNIIAYLNDGIEANVPESCKFEFIADGVQPIPDVPFTNQIATYHPTVGWVNTNQGICFAPGERICLRCEIDISLFNLTFEPLGEVFESAFLDVIPFYSEIPPIDGLIFNGNGINGLKEVDFQKLETPGFYEASICFRSEIDWENQTRYIVFQWRFNINGNTVYWYTPFRLSFTRLDNIGIDKMLVEWKDLNGDPVEFICLNEDTTLVGCVKENYAGTFVPIIYDGKYAEFEIFTDDVLPQRTDLPFIGNESDFATNSDACFKLNTLNLSEGENKVYSIIKRVGSSALDCSTHTPVTITVNWKQCGNSVYYSYSISGAVGNVKNVNTWFIHTDNGYQQIFNSQLESDSNTFTGNSIGIYKFIVRIELHDGCLFTWDEYYYAKDLKLNDNCEVQTLIKTFP